MDYISREDAIEPFVIATNGNRIPETDIDNMPVMVELRWVKRHLKGLPAADVVERKRGHWINHRNDSGHNIADCSLCGDTLQWFDDEATPKYCCMCGAELEDNE